MTTELFVVEDADGVMVGDGGDIDFQVFQTHAEAVDRAYQERDEAGDEEAFNVVRYVREPATPAPAHPDSVRLDWLAAHPNVSIEWDRDDEECHELVAYEETGFPNDREWHEIGRGKTYREAIDKAMAAASIGKRETVAPTGYPMRDSDW